MKIFGIHSCKSAIFAKPSQIRKIYTLRSKKKFDWIPTGFNVKELDEKDFCKLVPQDGVHQGICIDIDEDAYYCDITDFASLPENSCICMLDGVVDPHNLGAIIRSAAAFNVSGIIIGEKSSCKLNGTVVKTASGGIDYVDICVVKNLSAAIDKLKSYGFWLIALSEDGEKYLPEIGLRGKICVILGAEGQGIRRLPKEKSDFLVKIPTFTGFSTLNVSNAAAVIFYEHLRQNDNHYGLDTGAEHLLFT